MDPTRNQISCPENKARDGRIAQQFELDASESVMVTGITKPIEVGVVGGGE